VKNSLRINGLLLAMLLASQGADAAGLGKLSVKSALGQPLRAEIELLSVQPEEASLIQARLASAEAFQQARIERTEAHSSIQVSVQTRTSGVPYLRITSSRPVQDPFLELLIELNWNSGRVLRDYTLLLDPPKAPSAKPAAAPKAAAPAPQEVPVAAEPVSQPVVSKTLPSRPARPAPAAPASYGPVKPGDTLRSIAARVAHPDVTVEMMVASLYQANPGAFNNQNMNLLRKGEVLKVPDREAVMLMFSPHQARQLVRQHAQAWHAFRGQVADTATAASSQAASPSPAAGKIAPQAPQAKPDAAAPSRDVLKLSKSAQTAKSASNDVAMQRIQTLEEELAARSRALQEAQDRVAQLERTVSDLQKLMSMQVKPGAAPAQPAESPETAAGAPEAKAKPAAGKPKVMPEPPPPEPESSFLSELTSNPLYLGGAAILALLGGLFGYRRLSQRRSEAMENFHQSVLTGGDQFKTAIFRTEAGQPQNSKTHTEPKTELSRIGLGAIDTHDVDPINEAEVYMAYGRDAQAEEILKAAQAKDPHRKEITVKLLEIYANRSDAAAFAVLATQLFSDLNDPSSELWRKAAELGRRLEPNNPLYQTDAEPAAMPPERDMQDGRMGMEVTEMEMPGGEETPAEAAQPVQEEDLSIEFDPAAYKIDTGVIVEDGPAAGLQAEEEGAIALEPADIPPPAVEVEMERATVDLDVPLEFTPPEMHSQMAEKVDLPVDELSASPVLEIAGLEEPAAATPAAAEIEVASDTPLDFEPLEMVAPAAPGLHLEETEVLHDVSIDLDIPGDLPPEPETPSAFGDMDLEAASAGSEMSMNLPSLDDSAVVDTPPEIDLSAGLDDLALEELTLEGLDDSGADLAPEPLETADMPALDLSAIDLDLTDIPATLEEVTEMASEVDPAIWEEVNNQLELAVAYLEMGDQEGAREILNEVMAQGDDSQRARAAEMLEQAA